MIIETILFTSLSVMPQIVNKMSSTVQTHNVLAQKIEPKPITMTKEMILTALNEYRKQNGRSNLVIDSKLQEYAQKRVNELNKKGKLDNHAPFYQYMKTKRAFTDLKFNKLAENQSRNYKGNANSLISQFYAKSPSHNKNQLSNEYTHVGIGISGSFTNIVYGGNR